LPEVDCSNEEKVGVRFYPVDLRAYAILVTDCTALPAPGFYPFLRVFLGHECRRTRCAD